MAQVDRDRRARLVLQLQMQIATHGWTDVLAALASVADHDAATCFKTDQSMRRAKRHAERASVLRKLN